MDVDKVLSDIQEIKQLVDDGPAHVKLTEAQVRLTELKDAILTIDPEAIRAEARAEALREAVSRALAWKWPEDGTGCHDLFNRGVEVACSIIIADEPEKRGLDAGDKSL